VSVRPTFCAAPEDGMVYVQHRVEREAERVRALVEQGAVLFLCGDGARFAPAVREALARALGGDDALRALEREGRFVADVFS
jgi:cytochrome P450/NADPH-cytochrome P450 reductase